MRAFHTAAAGVAASLTVWNNMKNTDNFHPLKAAAQKEETSKTRFYNLPAARFGQRNLIFIKKVKSSRKILKFKKKLSNFQNVTNIKKLGGGN